MLLTSSNLKTSHSFPTLPQLYEFLRIQFGYIRAHCSIYYRNESLSHRSRDRSSQVVPARCFGDLLPWQVSCRNALPRAPIVRNRRIQIYWPSLIQWKNWRVSDARSCAIISETRGELCTADGSHSIRRSCVPKKWRRKSRISRPPPSIDKRKQQQTLC